ncbi:hypothetical protein PIB30_107553, partial [Stylosanthes scabra]|nr:hypothetical protein [Stylosanthes scabra]
SNHTHSCVRLVPTIAPQETTPKTDVSRALTRRLFLLCSSHLQRLLQIAQFSSGRFLKSPPPLLSSSLRDDSNGPNRVLNDHRTHPKTPPEAAVFIIIIFISR